MKSISDMTAEELKVELEKIRAERSGKGRIRRAVAKTRRIAGQISEKRQIANRQVEESAEWI